MRRIAAIMMILVLLGLCACSMPQSDSVSGSAPDDPGTEKARFADIEENWAWALANGEFDKPGDRLVAVSFASRDKLKDLGVAVSAGTLVSVQYSEEKEATGRNGDYYPTFEGVAGPCWTVGEGALDLGQADVLLLPDSCRIGILQFAIAANEGGQSDIGHGHPAADPTDISSVEKMAPGRTVISSELLATDSSGGRVSIFQFNSTDHGLIVLAYCRGDQVITREYISNGVYEGKAYWRADAEADDICLFEVKLLCDTDAGLVIGLAWYGPEGATRSLFVEKDGKFADFISDLWYYSVFEQAFQHETIDLS